MKKFTSLLLLTAMFAMSIPMASAANSYAGENHNHVRLGATRGWDFAQAGETKHLLTSFKIKGVDHNVFFDSATITAYIDNDWRRDFEIAEENGVHYMDMIENVTLTVEGREDRVVQGSMDAETGEISFPNVGAIVWANEITTFSIHADIKEDAPVGPLLQLDIADVSEDLDGRSFRTWETVNFGDVESDRPNKDRRKTMVY